MKQKRRSMEEIIRIIRQADEVIQFRAILAYKKRASDPPAHR
jgi:hypothetical protein